MENHAQEKFFCASCELEISDREWDRCDGLCEDCYADMTQDQAQRWGEPALADCPKEMYGIDK